MKAVVSMKLEHPTRSGRTVMVESIIGRKEYIVGMVNEFIEDRMNKPEGWIKVVTFDVEFFDSRNNVVDKWSYSPTYRQ